MKRILLVVFFMITGVYLHAQHEHHAPAPVKDTTKKVVSKKKPATRKPAKPVVNKNNAHQVTMDDPHAGHKMEEMLPMPSHSFSRSLPMNRNGSGTGWNPDQSPMYMWMKQAPKTD